MAKLSLEQFAELVAMRICGGMAAAALMHNAELTEDEMRFLRLKDWTVRDLSDFYFAMGVRPDFMLEPMEGKDDE